MIRLLLCSVVCALIALFPSATPVPAATTTCRWGSQTHSSSYSSRVPKVTNRGGVYQLLPTLVRLSRPGGSLRASRSGGESSVSERYYASTIISDARGIRSSTLNARPAALEAMKERVWAKNSVNPHYNAIGLLDKDVLFTPPDVLQSSRTHSHEGSSSRSRISDDIHGQIDTTSNPKHDIVISSKDAALMQQWHGTTTLSLRVQGGIVVAVDSRASIGSFVGSHTTKKVLPIAPHIVATMAGGAADCQHILRELSGQVRLLQDSLGRRGSAMGGHIADAETGGVMLDVGLVARMLAKKLRSLPADEVSMGTMVSGYDLNGPSLYYIDDHGNCIKGDFFAVGSGSLIAHSILQSEYSGIKDQSKNLQSNNISYNSSFPSVETGINLALRAVRHAINRDCYSGGYINVFFVNSTGFHHLVRKYYDEIEL